MKKLVSTEVPIEIKEKMRKSSEALGSTMREMNELALIYVWRDHYEDFRSFYIKESTVELEVPKQTNNEISDDEDLNSGLDPSKLPGSSPTEEDEEFAREQTKEETLDDVMDDIDSLGEDE